MSVHPKTDGGMALTFLFASKENSPGWGNIYSIASLYQLSLCMGLSFSP